MSAKIAAYANRTGTRRNLEALDAAGWGLLVCANTRGASNHRTEGFADYMLDNAAYKCRDKGETAQARLEHWEAVYLDPFDGSGPSKFADCLRRVDAGRGPVQMTAPGLELSSPFTPREGVFR